MVNEISQEMPDLDVSFKEQSVAGGNALRCTFADIKEVSGDEMTKFYNLLKKDGWGFYSRRGNNLYFTK